jgi:hypothetical protein
MILAPAAASVLALSGCVAEIGPPGPTRTETRTIELDKSDLVRVELKMGAGELDVRGGASNLMDGEFTYNRPSSKPYVNYNASGFRGTLRVEEPSGTHTGNTKYRWDLRLNDDKPLDLNVDFGAGEGRLDLGTLNLRSVNVHMGVGELRVDLRGTPKNDYNVDLRGGVGEVTVYLPRDVGIEAEAHGGIGGINARGLQKRDGRYTNEAYGHAKTTVRLDIKGGIGAINLVGGD